MMMDNVAQQRICSKDSVGYGITFAGVVLAFVSAGFAFGNFAAYYRGFDLSGFLTVLVGSLSGFTLGLGTAIGLPDNLTDRLFDQEHIWKLLVVVTLLVVVVAVVLQA